MTTQQPLTKKEEEEKETTTDENVRIYKCLEEETRLTTYEKKIIMRRGYPEKRIDLALEYSRIEPIRKSLISTIIWHCQQELPPEPIKTCKTNIEIRAWEFNNYLKDNGHSNLAEKNMQAIPLGHMFIPTPNGSTTITLNTTLEGFEKDVAECIELMFNGQ